ncbi:MAG: polysaccharide deacetylase family protein [Selenomonadaceae bacterium]
MNFGQRKKISLRKKILLLVLLFCMPIVLVSPHNMTANMLKECTNGTKVVVLNYHKIDNMNISLSVLPKDFDQQMAYLKKNNYHTITPNELYDSLNNGTELPENPVILTFDDGYRDNYTYAYPILKKYGFKGTIFVITSFMDVQPNYITWEQAKEMEADGTIDIESHTVDHKSMTGLSDDQLRDELVLSKREIEQRLGKQVNFMAYPTGTYNLHIAQFVKEAGYKGAFTIKYGNVDKASNVYALERVPIFHTADTFKSFCERLQYIPVFERLGWIKS